MSALVLGIGNVLLGDEGTGVMAVEELRRRYAFSDDVMILDGGTAGMELLPHLSEKDHLVIIDALQNGHPPGTVARVAGEDVPARFMARISPHQLGLSDLLAAAVLTRNLPPHIVLFGVEPASLNTGIGLSPPVLAAMEKLLPAVAEELTSLGYKAAPRPFPEEEKGFWSRA